MRNETLLLCLALALFCGCGTGGEDVEPPTHSIINIVRSSDGMARIAAPSGSADSGTEVRLAAPASGSDNVRSDGGFFFEGTIGDAASVTVNYTKQGEPLSTVITPVSLESRVDTGFASTGAGPNDLALAGNSLYVANSLDNTVARLDLDGEPLASETFPQFSSPSYLAVDSGFLYVVRNGDNIISRHDPLTLQPSAPASEVLLGAGSSAVFLGPGPLAVDNNIVFSAFAGISDFGPPSLYEATGGAAVNMETEQVHSSFDLEGFENGQEVELTSDGSLLYVVTAGSLQFDENFSPFVTSDSHLHVFSTAGLAESAEPLESMNLGRIGASRIALHPEGEELAYLTSLLNGNLYKVDLVEMELLRGEQNPLVLTTEFTYLSDIEFTPDGELLLATSFNTDQLFILNPDSDQLHPGLYGGPIDLSLDPQLLAGCQSLEVGPNPDRPGSYRAYVLYAIANGVATFDLF